MLRPLDDLRLDEFQSWLEETYALDMGGLRFVPLGEDSWSFSTDRYWVSLRRDIRGFHEACYEVPAILSRMNLAWVLPNIEAIDGAVAPFYSCHPVVVTDRVGELAAPSPQASASDVAVVLNELHEITELPVPVKSETFEVRVLSLLTDSLQHLEFKHDKQSRDVSRRCRLYNDVIWSASRAVLELGEWASREDLSFVLTHGDAVPQNFIHTKDSIYLCDWGDCLWAPVERDWSRLSKSYRSGNLLQPDLVRFYHLQWQLYEVREYVDYFTSTKNRNPEDDFAMSARLDQALDALSNLETIGEC